MKILEINHQKMQVTEEQKVWLNQLYIYLESCEQPEKPLRELKLRFKAWQTMAEDVDLFVKLGILERYDRRYRFCLKSINVEDNLVFQDKAEEIIDGLPTISVKVKLELAQLIGNQRKAAFVIAEESFVSSYKIAESQSETLTFIDVVENDEIVGLASYFNSADKQQHPKAQMILKKIGDVNQEFFMTFSERVLLMLTKESNSPVRQSIFTDTLEEFGYIDYSEDGKQATLTVDVENWTKSDQEKLEGCYQSVMLCLKDESTLARTMIINKLIKALLTQHASQQFVFKKGVEITDD